MGNLVLRGIVIGIVAGLLAFAFAKAFGEPAVAVAINFESAQDDAARDAAIAKGEKVAPEEPEMFSRQIQTGVGLLTGVVGIGVGIGGLFAVLFAFGYGRMGSLGAKPTAALLALICLVTLYVVPALKYPANPPSVGLPETIKLRTGLYFLVMALSVVATLGGLYLRQRLLPRYQGWNATWMAVAAYGVAIAAIFVVLPHVNEVPATFPAVTLWDFRLASLGIQTVLWGSVGLLFGYFNGLEKA